MASLNINHSMRVTMSLSLFSFSLFLCCYVSAQDQPVLTIQVPALGSHYRAAAFSPDGNTILTGGTELALWDVKTGYCLRKYRDDRVSEYVLFSPNGRIVAAAYPHQHSSEVCIKIWDLQRGDVLFMPCYSMDIPENWESENTWIAMAFSRDGKTLLTGDLEGTLVEWDTETGMESRRLDLPIGHPAQLLLLPSGNQVIVSDQSADVYLYDLETGEKRYTFAGFYASLSRDGTRLLFNGDGSIRLHDAATGDLIRSIPSEIVPVKQSVVLCPDGALAIVDAASGAEETYPLKVLDMNTGEVLRRYPGTSGLLIGISPDGKYFLRAENGRLLLYDISDLQAAVKEPSVEKQE